MLTDNTKLMQEFQSYEQKVLDELKVQISTEKDAEKLLDLKNDYKFLSNIMKPEVELRLPDITFEGKLTFHGKDRHAELIAFDIAHSPGDVILYLPIEKICFTGDLLFKDSHPWLGTGAPEKLIDVLEELLQLDVEVFISGHGDLGTKSDIRLEIKYIKELLALVEAKKAKGDTADMVNLKDISPQFKDWSGLSFPRNINYLFRREKH
jgi:glyoxylase-like metal-dependent hydrolase (beta-lactamase superfamily II)